MIFKGGKKMDTIIGAVPKATLVQALGMFRKEHYLFCSFALVTQHELQ